MSGGNGLEVDIDFLRQALHNPKDRLFVLKVEQQMKQFLQKITSGNSETEENSSGIKFPPMNSYQRMIVHKVADYFQLAHLADSTEQCVLIHPTDCSKIPEKNLVSFVAGSENTNEMDAVAEGKPVRKIIQRRPQTNKHTEQKSHGAEVLKNKVDQEQAENINSSLEQREAEYQRARAALFEKEDDEHMDRIVSIENTISVSTTVNQVTFVPPPVPSEKRQELTTTLNPWAAEFQPKGNFSFNS